VAHVGRARLRYGVPICQRIPADPVDKQVVRAFFEALSCAELDLYDQALQEQNAMTLIKFSRPCGVLDNQSIQASGKIVTSTIVRPFGQAMVDFALVSAMLSPFLLTPDKSSITLCLVDCRGGI
jgi:hypothetical protein